MTEIDRKMAAHMRPGDRTFFVYDHSVIKKEDDDPKDAIIYYFPQHTSIDVQCIFCNQLMGMVNCTKAIGGAPPKLYKLRKLKVATIHEGNFSVALACKLRTPDTAIIRKLENLYKVFAFYHCSITRVKRLSSNNEAFLSNMAAIWDFYVPYVRRYGNTVPAMFEPIPSVKLLKGGNVIFLRCSHLLQWLKGQPSLLAGCILYKQSVLCTQLTPELTSHLLLIKPNQLHHPSKSVTDTVLPFGVRIMSVYVTQQQYKQLSTPLEPLLKPRPSPVQTKQPEGIFCTPPSSPTEKSNGKNQPLTSNQAVSKRTLERRISSKLFSNFTGMLEGTVVESLWPSTSKSSRPSSRSESPWEDSKRDNWKAGSPSWMASTSKSSRPSSRSESPWEDSKRDNQKYRSPSSMQDGGYEVVVLSSSSDDVVKALQEDGGSSVREVTGISPSDAQMASGHYDITDVSDSKQRPFDCPDLLTEPRSSQNSKIVLSEAPLAKNDTTTSKAKNETDLGYAEMNLPNGTACLEDGQQSFAEEGRLKDNVLEAEAERDTLSEQKVHSDSVEESHAQTGVAVTYASTDCSRGKDLGEEIISESNKQLSFPSESLKAIPNVSEQKSESPESGIGDCLAEDFSGKNPGTDEKDNGFVEREEIGNFVDVIPAGDAPISDGDCNRSIVCEDKHSDNPVDAKNTTNAMSDQCLCNDDSKSGLDKGSDAYCKNGNVSLLISTDKVDGIESNVRLNSVDTNNEYNSSIIEDSVGSKEIGNISGTSDGDHNLVREVSQLNGDVLRSARDELGEDPDLVESSQMPESAVKDERRGDLEDVNLNVKYEETEQIPTESSPECERKGAVGDVRVEDELEKARLSEEEDKCSDEDERTILAEDEGIEVVIANGQASLNMDVKSDNEGPSDKIATESSRRLSFNLDTEVQVPQSREENKSEVSQDLAEAVGRHGGFADVQSMKEKPGNDNECSVINTEGPGQEAVQALGVNVPDVQESIKADAPDELEGARPGEVGESLEGRTTGNEPEVHLNTSSSSSGIGTREDDASLRDNVNEKEGEAYEEIGDVRQEDIGESVEGYAEETRPILEGDFSTMQHDTELSPDLVNVSLYVQAHSDTTLLFLAEKSITEEKETLFQLWQSVLRELGELELQLKNVVRPDRELDCKGAYNFMHFDNEQKLLEGSISNPVNQAESVFCRGCQQIHEQFLSDETLTDVTLRNHQTVVHAHQSACQHTFYHKNHKPSPTPGIPSRDDAAFYIQNSCKESLREHNIHLL
ncbi:uncharacterized protein LOC119726240 isoform X2 [Patiria miniata]|uniref:CCZ1/INTU/HSP4 first Longin domain-containing protein n=1 Tax=Patiria miniata TaxID=46514 RepID=A0A913ZRK7_PATMI|nr:uncharacterized protein LOC119726240 isoform X2 [Patiria miniata]